MAKGKKAGTNQKQAGSNLMNAEFHTGRCRTFCEQCFVNFGSRGNCMVRGMLGDEPKNHKLFAWIAESKAAEKQAGGIPSVPYAPPNPVAKNTPLPTDGDFELLGWHLAKTGKGLLNVPMKAAWKPWVVTAKGAKSKSGINIPGFGTVPLILRVSSMSDSSWASSEWVDSIRAAWGEYCFFNSCIKAIRKRPAMLEHYHKVVVTLNPGKQAMPPIEPAYYRAAFDSAERIAVKIKRCVGRDVERFGKGADRDKLRVDCEERVLAKFAKDLAKRKAVMQPNPKTDHYPLGSMGQVRDVPADFLHPLTVSEVTGNADDERRIKFYRVRALATVHPYINDLQEQTGNPLVATQMRFVTMGHLLEFARRYKLTVRIDAKPGAAGAKALVPYIAPFKQFEGKGKLFTMSDKARENRVYVRSARDDMRNGSPLRGEECSFEWRGNFLRNADREKFEDCDYVCDRAWGSCKHCGLCASLDGQGVVVKGQKWTNPYNVMPDGKPWPAYAGPGHGYIQTLLDTGEQDYFKVVLNDIAGGDDWQANPGYIEPTHPDNCKAAFQQVYAYAMDGATVDAEFCDSWNTHEDAATVVAFAFWSLLCHGKRRGLSRAANLAQAFDAVIDATGGLEVLHGVEACLEMVDDASPWNMQFGPVR